MNSVIHCNLMLFSPFISKNSDMIQVYDRATESLKFEEKKPVAGGDNPIVKNAAQRKQRLTSPKRPEMPALKLEPKQPVATTSSLAKLLMNRPLNEASLYQTGTARLPRRTKNKSGRNVHLPTYHSATLLGQLSESTILGGQSIKMNSLHKSNLPERLFDLDKLNSSVISLSNLEKNSLNKSDRLRSSVKATGIVCPKVVEMDINRSYYNSIKHLKK